MTAHRLTHPIRRGWRRARFINRALYPVSLIYVAVMAVRSFLYRVGIFAQYEVPVPVVVVGNLSVGGVGKTPLVLALAEHFKQRGMSPAILTRGYGGNKKHPRLVTASDTAEQVGDEALLMFRRGMSVMVSPDRVRGARMLAADFDIIVSDDGFQHLRLAREVDIVVLDERKFGNGWCLPAGPLREPRGAIARADFVVVNNAPAARGEFEMNTRIDRAVNLAGETKMLTDFGGQTAHAVSAIGNNQKFFRQLAEYKINLHEHPFPDHHRFSAAELNFVGDDAVLTTEKDAVKLEAVLPREMFNRCWVVPLNVTLPENFFDGVHSKLKP